jgi:hypothetical protein
MDKVRKASNSVGGTWFELMVRQDILTEFSSFLKPLAIKRTAKGLNENNAV